MTKFKRTLVPGTYLTAADMLSVLSQQEFTAAAVDDCVMLAAEPAMAWLLDSCCVGTLTGECSIPTAHEIGSRAIVAAAACGNGDSIDVQCDDVGMDLHIRAQQVVATSGIVRASEVLQQQHQQHQQRMMNRRQRRAKRTYMYTTAAGAGAASSLVAAVSGSAGNAAVVEGIIPPPAASVAGSNEHETVASLADAAHPAHPAEAEAVRAEALQAVGGAIDGATEIIQLVQLSLQEAFYLMHVLCCCRVFTANHRAAQQGLDPALEVQQSMEHHQQQQDTRIGKGQVHTAVQLQEARKAQELTTDAFWGWCCSVAGGHLAFASKYAAYHHFRSKGWLPRSGIVYGADYVLYQLHPEHAHSDYVVSVLVERSSAAAVEPESQTRAGATGADTAMLLTRSDDSAASKLHVQYSRASEAEQQQQQFEHQQPLLDSSVDSGIRTNMLWLDAHILQRLARQVLKQLLLLYVVVPEGVSLQSHACMQQLAVKEALVKRWVPSEHRNDAK